MRRFRSAAEFPHDAATRVSRAHSRGRHDANDDAIDLATPLGQTLAQLEGDARGVTVRLQDGRVETGETWSELTERAFGVTIPVEGLSAWVRGVPRADSAFTAERDRAGRVSLLRQDGWEVVYAYADDALAAAVPRQPELSGRRSGRGAGRRRSLAVTRGSRVCGGGIDTFGAVGENGCLFRRLRTTTCRSTRRRSFRLHRSRNHWIGPWRGAERTLRARFRWGVAKLVKAPDFDSGIRGFESFLPSHFRIDSSRLRCGSLPA